MNETTGTRIIGRRAVLMIGMWSARLYFVLTIAYAAAVVAAVVAAGAAGYGSLTSPYWAMAEIIIVVGAVNVVMLMAAIHDFAPLRSKIFTRMAFGWTLVTAALTITVHFVELTVVRRVDAHAIPGFPRLFDFQWPSLLVAVELLAWHLFFGLALLFAAFAFSSRGTAAIVRIGMTISGALCVAGLLGPALGDLNWRYLGVFGYGVVFPLVCLIIGREFKRAASSLDQDRGDPPPAAVTTRDQERQNVHLTVPALRQAGQLTGRRSGLPAA
jgi:hypothetical protein